MEVHDHAHTTRKKWTHYLWEFFMLFLAVTLGFFVENQREHFVEHKKEKDFMTSLLVDLDNDSTQLKSWETLIAKQIDGLDSLIIALRDSLTVNKNLDLAYILYMKYGMTAYPVFLNNNTMSQLMNGGGLRLIRSSGVLEKIHNYEASKKIVMENSSSLVDMVTDIERNHANHLFDFTIEPDLMPLAQQNGFTSNTDSLLSMAASGPAHLIDKNVTKVAIFRNDIKSLHSVVQSFEYFVQLAFKRNRLLSETIKSSYNF